ncbi:MAG: VWA domain-containing protein [Pseudomonadota bacterium]
MTFVRPLLDALRAAGLALACSLAALFIGAVAAYPSIAFAKPVEGTETVTVRADLGHSVIPSKGGKIYLHIELTALRLERDEADRTPVNLALVVDQSGSMRGDRLRSAKRAANEALSRLSRDDMIALVAYNHEVDVLRKAGPVRGFSALEDAIDRLRASGRTALYAGVKEGGRQVERFYSDRRVNRVILLSDGMANVGPSKPHQLSKLGQALAQDGISVSTVGLGLNYNEDLMQQLALASDGNHSFAETADDLVRIFNAEFGDAMENVAQDIEIIIETRRGFTPTRIMGPIGEISDNRVKVKLNKLGSGSDRFLIVEMTADGADDVDVGREAIASVKVDYMDLQGGQRRSANREVTAKRSSDAALIKESADQTVLAKVAGYRANLAETEAIQLRDRGDVAGARKILEENVKALDASAAVTGLSSEMTSRLKRKADKARQSAKALDDRDWAKTRKSLRYEQHRYGTMQKF